MLLAGQPPENQPQPSGEVGVVLNAIVDLLGGVDVAEIAEDDCMAVVSRLAHVRSVVDAIESQVLSRLERAQTTVVETGHTTARWLSNETGQPHAATKCRVHVSRKLHDHFDAVQAALGEGRISFAHAKAIVDAANPRILDQLVEIQDQLVKIAEAADRFERFSRELQSIVNLLDQDGAFDPNGETQKNRLAFRFDPDGVRIDGKLVGVSAAAVKETLNRIADELFKQQCPDEPALSWPQLLAEALIELCRRGTANGTSGRIPQADITLIINADDLNRAVTPDGQMIDGGSLKRACCDANITTVTTNDDGQPLNVGRTRRLATDAQRRAAMVRDGDACSRAATCPPTGATCTTSSNGKTVAQPTSTTLHVYADATTDSPTPTAGIWKRPAHPDDSNGPHQPAAHCTPNTTHPSFRKAAT